ncbi:TPA: oxidoreductase [Enterobacter hormaechei]
MNQPAEQATAIVTGASSGIGKASAEALARAGFKVFGTSRRTTENGSGHIVMLTCDVTDDASVAALVSDVLAQTGRIDLLVNNAGVGLFGGAEESSIDQVRAVFDVNLFGAMRMTHAVLPTMRHRGGGRILNISSVLGFIPAPYAAHYAATKHALEGYSESLDHEARAFGVRVSLVEPAFTRSAFDQSALKCDASLPVYDEARSRVDELVKQAMTLGDRPEVVAEVVVRAATTIKPKRRYCAGMTAKQINVLRRFAPASLFDGIVRKQFGLPV